jgi:septal ring factor EnvC (AmiA/AmiB activator)
MAIERGDLGFLFGLSGFLLGAAAFYFSFQVSARAKAEETLREHDAEMIDTLATEQGAMRTDLQEANKRISSLRKELTDGMNDVGALRKRIDALEAAKPK